MDILRILVTGGVGAGKTSFIRTISEIEVVDTDKKATDEVAKLKDKTTVALDFGRLTLVPNQSIHLYGTPGQTRFDFMRDILLNNANAYILLIDVSNPGNISQSSHIYQFMNQQATIPMIIGLTHTDCFGAVSSEVVAKALEIPSIEEVPIMEVNTNDRDSSLLLLTTLIKINFGV